jgi:hypothetical protein
LLQRVLLALIPVALLTTVSLAFSVLNQQPIVPASTPVDEPAAPAVSTEAAPPRYMTSTNVDPSTLVAQTQPSGDPDQVAQADEQHKKTIDELQQMAEEPLPELVVDKTPLTQAMTDLSRAIEQAKLSVTSLDAQGQGQHIQETINFLAGYKDAAFSATPITVKPESYAGVRPLLIEARVVREAAEVQWVAAVQRQLEARSKRLAEIAQAGNANGTVPQAQAQAPGTAEIAQVVGPSGVLGTRGVRPEEQANELISRAIRQASEALRLVPGGSRTSGNEETLTHAGASDQAIQTMEYVVRTLESAMKIIQIAANR